MKLNVTSKGNAMAAQRLMMRNKFWPEVTPEHLWHPKGRPGWIIIPRTMPLIIGIINSLSPAGCPTGAVYLDLWCRIFDESFVILNKPADMAFGSGFRNQRGVQTWTKRMDLLEKLGFIKLASGPYGKRSYALILNPHKVIEELYAKKSSTVPNDLYNTLFARGQEVKSPDFMVKLEEIGGV